MTGGVISLFVALAAVKGFRGEFGCSGVGS